MKTSATGLALIEESEGLRTEPYLDVAGFPTIGYGHKILPGEDFSAGITQEQAANILASDVANAEASVNHLMDPSCNQNQFDALVDFTFNLGGTPLATMLHHGWGQVPVQIPAWCYARVNGVLQKSPGLEARRAREVALFTTAEA